MTDHHTLALFAGPVAATVVRVAVNAPFAGALVPRSRYRTDPRVRAVMVEVNRRLYVREDDAAPLADFDRIGQRIRHCCRVALHGIA